MMRIGEVCGFSEMELTLKKNFTEYQFLTECEKKYSACINFDGDDATYWHDVFLISLYSDGRYNLCRRSGWCADDCTNCDDKINPTKDYRNDLTRVDLADYIKDFKDLRRLSRETTIPVPVLRRFLNGAELLPIWITVLTKWVKGDSPVADIREAQFYRKQQLYTISDIDDVMYFLDYYPSGIAKEASGLDRALIESQMCGIVDSLTDKVYSHN